MAKAYDELSTSQFETASEFIRQLNLMNLGDKVLDMGCGTGLVTKYIADIVGPDGQAVGIDPDAERIKIAEKNYKEVSNLQFHVGNSATGFPHDNEPYYDVHISTHAFHWVPGEQKRIYIQKAYQCLKPGGRLAIYCCTKMPNIEEMGYHLLSQEGYQDLFQELDLFTSVVVDKVVYSSQFKSVEEFKRWFKASAYKDADDCPEYTKKYLSSDEGQVTFNLPYVSIIACKN